MAQALPLAAATMGFVRSLRCLHQSDLSGLQIESHHRIAVVAGRIRMAVRHKSMLATFTQENQFSG